MEGENKDRAAAEKINGRGEQDDRAAAENKKRTRGQSSSREYIEDIYFLGVNTKYISLSAVKKSVFFTSALHE